MHCLIFSPWVTWEHIMWRVVLHHQCFASCVCKPPSLQCAPAITKNVGTGGRRHSCIFCHLLGGAEILWDPQLLACKQVTQLQMLQSVLECMYINEKVRFEKIRPSCRPWPLQIKPGVIYLQNMVKCKYLYIYKLVFCVPAFSRAPPIQPAKLAMKIGLF